MSIENLSNLIITNVRSVASLYNPANTKGRRHQRSCWAVVLKYEGETVYTSSEKQVLSNLNHAAILPKGSSYDWQCTSSGHFYIIEFDAESSYDQLLSFNVKNNDKLLKLFKELEYRHNKREPLYEIESIRDTYSIILNIVSAEFAKYVPDSKRQKLQPALDYISQNFGSEISNDKLASLCGMSTVYFRKLFSEIIGVSPIKYARQLRIEKAKEMLKSDYGNLSDIAVSLGYSNLYDFSRDFKKHTGVAPSKF